MNPRVSVLMAVNDGISFLAESVESILNQSFQDFEFIIIDDYSQDGSQNLLTEYAENDARIRLLRNDQNSGLTKSLNRGLEKIRGEFVARHDADDLAHEHRFRKQVDYFDHNPDTGLLGTGYRTIDGEGNFINEHVNPQTHTANLWQLHFHNSFCHSSVMVRSHLLSEHSLKYDESIIFSQDYDLWSRVLTKTRGVNIPDILVSYRQHESNIKSRNYEEQQNFANSIALRNVRSTAPNLEIDRSTVSILRTWFNGFPEKSSSDDLSYWYDLFYILNQVARHPGVCRHELKEIRLRLIRKFFRALTLTLLLPSYRKGILHQAFDGKFNDLVFSGTRKFLGQNFSIHGLEDRD